MSELFGATFERVEGAMRFRVARQSVLSGNVANADTPGYRRFDLKVDELLQDTPLSRTDARHLNAGGLNAKDWNIERGDFGTRPDRNGVDIDQELITMSRNASAFVQQAEVLSRLLSIRRVAVTGEPR